MNPFPVVAKFPKFLAAVLCLLSITAAGQKNLSAYQKTFQTDPWLKHWANTMPHFNLSTFLYTRTSAFENSIEDNQLSNDNNAFRQTYGKLISYSPDKKKYLDFYSGQIVFDTIHTNGKITVSPAFDIDQYFFLGDYTRHTATRLLFMGSSAALEEATWISDSAFILVGTVREQNYYYPFIYIGDLERQQFDYYLPKNKNIKRENVYRSPKWKLLKGVTFKD